MGNTIIVAGMRDENNGGDFNKLLKSFEIAYARGDYSTELMEISTAIAYSVLNKVLDPSRNTAATPRKDGSTRDVSNSGNNPALLEVKHGLSRDLRTLSETEYTVENATRLEYDREECEWKEVTDDKAAAGYVRKIMSSTLSDGMDIVNETAMAILSIAEQYADEVNWITKKIVVRRLGRRVYIRLDDSAAYRDEETTPLQEIYRHVREYIRGTQSARVDTGKYLYIDGEDPETIERVYYRLGKYEDLGTETEYGYAANEQTALDMTNALEKLNLTARQAEVLNLRMKGHGYKAISTYLGVCNNAVVKTCKQIQKKAIECGMLDIPSIKRFEDKPERKPDNEPRTASEPCTVNHWEELENLLNPSHDENEICD